MTQFDRMSGQVELPRMPSLCSSLPMVKPGVPFSTRKAVSFSHHSARAGVGVGRHLAFGEDGEDVGEARVGDPHLLAVEGVGLPVGGEDGAGAGVEGVGAGGGFGERVGADEGAVGEFGEVLLFLLGGAVPDDGQSTYAGVGGEGYGEAALLGDVVGDDGGGHLVHLEAAVLFGDVDGGEAEVGGLLDEAAGDAKSLASMASEAGTISLRAKSAVVWAIWRCSSVKSSGKKQSAGEGLAMRKLPPGMMAVRFVFSTLLYDFHVPIPSLPYFVQNLQNIRLRSGPCSQSPDSKGCVLQILPNMGFSCGLRRKKVVGFGVAPCVYYMRGVKGLMALTDWRGISESIAAMTRSSL